MNTPRPWEEFQLPQDVGLQRRLEEKRKEYWERLVAPNPQSGWSSWQQCDLIRRHDSDPRFRLLYYKLVVLTNILMACEKHTELQKRTGGNGLPEAIESRVIGAGLSESFGRPITSDEFESACEVIHNYLTNPESLN